MRRGMIFSTYTDFIRFTFSDSDFSTKTGPVDAFTCNPATLLGVLRSGIRIGIGADKRLRNEREENEEEEVEGRRVTDAILKERKDKRDGETKCSFSLFLSQLSFAGWEENVTCK